MKALFEWMQNVKRDERPLKIHARGHEVEPEDLPGKFQSPQLKANARSPLSALFGDLPSLDELERRYLIHVLEPPRTTAPGPLRFMGIDRQFSTSSESYFKNQKALVPSSPTWNIG